MFFFIVSKFQGHHFWGQNMSGINWKKVFTRYNQLIDRVGTKSEFSDLVWEMQGELGTSHCYEFGGDYKTKRNYNIGLLGAQLEFDENLKATLKTEKLSTRDSRAVERKKPGQPGARKRFQFSKR